MVLSGVLTACGGGSDGGTANKNLFSKWTSADNEYDLTGMQFDMVYELTVSVASNTGMIYDLTVSGTEESGSFYLANCQHYGPQNFCQAGTTQYNYTKSGASLTICDGSNMNCEVFR